MLLTQECIPKLAVDLQRIQTACLAEFISYFNNIYFDHAPN